MTPWIKVDKLLILAEYFAIDSNSNSNQTPRVCINNFIVTLLFVH